MTIEEYKQKFIELYKKMEEEHGRCKCVEVYIESEFKNECFHERIIDCKIEF